MPKYKTLSVDGNFNIASKITNNNWQEEKKNNSAVSKMFRQPPIRTYERKKGVAHWLTSGTSGITRENIPPDRELQPKEYKEFHDTDESMDYDPYDTTFDRLVKDTKMPPIPPYEDSNTSYSDSSSNAKPSEPNSLDEDSLGAPFDNPEPLQRPKVVKKRRDNKKEKIEDLDMSITSKRQTRETKNRKRLSISSFNDENTEPNVKVTEAQNSGVKKKFSRKKTAQTKLPVVDKKTKNVIVRGGKKKNKNLVNFRAIKRCSVSLKRLSISLENSTISHNRESSQSKKNRQDEIVESSKEGKLNKSQLSCDVLKVSNDLVVKSIAHNRESSQSKENRQDKSVESSKEEKSRQGQLNDDLSDVSNDSIVESSVVESSTRGEKRVMKNLKNPFVSLPRLTVGRLSTRDFSSSTPISKNDTKAKSLLRLSPISNDLSEEMEDHTDDLKLSTLPEKSIVQEFEPVPSTSTAVTPPRNSKENKLEKSSKRLLHIPSDSPDPNPSSLMFNDTDTTMEKSHSPSSFKNLPNVTDPSTNSPFAGFTRESSDHESLHLAYEDVEDPPSTDISVNAEIVQNSSREISKEDHLESMKNLTNDPFMGFFSTQEKHEEKARKKSRKIDDDDDEWSTISGSLNAMSEKSLSTTYKTVEIQDELADFVDASGNSPNKVESNNGESTQFESDESARVEFKDLGKTAKSVGEEKEKETTIEVLSSRENSLNDDVLDLADASGFSPSKMERTDEESTQFHADESSKVESDDLEKTEKSVEKRKEKELMKNKRLSLHPIVLLSRLKVPFDKTVSSESFIKITRRDAPSNTLELISELSTDNEIKSNFAERSRDPMKLSSKQLEMEFGSGTEESQVEMESLKVEEVNENMPEDEKSTIMENRKKDSSKDSSRLGNRKIDTSKDSSRSENREKESSKDSSRLGNRKIDASKDSSRSENREKESSKDSSRLEKSANTRDASTMSVEKSTTEELTKSESSTRAGLSEKSRAEKPEKMEINEKDDSQDDLIQPVVLLTRLNDPFRITKRRKKYHNFDLQLSAISENRAARKTKSIHQEKDDDSFDIAEKKSEVNMVRNDSKMKLSGESSRVSTQTINSQDTTVSYRSSIFLGHHNESTRDDKVVFLKPGKSWARSLSILSQIHSQDDLESLAVGKGRKWRESVQDLLEMQQQGLIQSCVKKNEDDKERSYSGLRNSNAAPWIPGSSQSDTSRLFSATSPGRFVRRVSIRVVPDGKSSDRIKDTSFLEAYGITQTEDRKTLAESRTLITPRQTLVYNVKPDNPSAGHIPKSLKTVKSRDVVLAQCGQDTSLPFEECYPKAYLEKCRKIGEGVYGEVFLYQNGTERNVIKIIPIEGEMKINSERQKKFDEILSEIVIAKELHNLRFSDRSNTSSFVEVKNIRCVKGKYPDILIDLWNDYDEEKQSENDCPSIFEKNQLYIVLELGHAGEDLEAFVFQNATEAHALFMQTALALAVAEDSLEFEHRDLHWGNVLISRTNSTQIDFKLQDKPISVASKGVKVCVIDFTLSRMSYQGCSIFNDLSMDDDLFVAQGEYQFDIYRLMRQKIENNWQTFEPFTNILWLHYILDKMIKAVRYKRKSTKIHKAGIAKLQDLKNEILEYKSAVDFVTYCDRAKRLQGSRSSYSTVESTS